MPRKSAAQRLKLNVSAVEIASVGGARGSRPTRAGRLRKRTSTKVRFVVRRRDFEIRIATNPVVREKCPWWRRQIRNAGRPSSKVLRVGGKSRDGHGYGQKNKN